MIYLLFDNLGDKGKVSFILQLTHYEMKEVYSPLSKKLIVSWLRGCLVVLKKSTANDTIVCWYDFQAILCYWLCRFFLKKRKIVCINLLLKDKTSLKNKIVAWLYKKALNGKNLVASVTSMEYGEHLRQRLNVKKDFFLLHDVYRTSYDIRGRQITPPRPSKSVFCGGRNGRDWHFMVDVARAMPDVEFHLVMPENIYQELEHELPYNVTAKYNLSMDDFLWEMCRSEIVALPLDTEAPAGLIVIFQAAANKKYIITTDTMTTREYLSDGCGCLVSNNVADWVYALRSALGNTEDCLASSKKLKTFLEQNCSEAAFVQGIEKMIEEV